jgi:hypothetical protein
MAQGSGLGSVIASIGTIYGGAAAKSEGKTAYQYSLFNADLDRKEGHGDGRGDLPRVIAQVRAPPAPIWTLFTTVVHLKFATR